MDWMRANREAFGARRKAAAASAVERYLAAERAGKEPGSCEIAQAGELLGRAPAIGHSWNSRAGHELVIEFQHRQRD